MNNENQTDPSDFGLAIKRRRNKDKERCLHDLLPGGRSHGKRALIVAPPNSGKTHLLRKLVSQTLDVCPLSRILIVVATSKTAYLWKSESAKPMRVVISNDDFLDLQDTSGVFVASCISTDLFSSRILENIDWDLIVVDSVDSHNGDTEVDSPMNGEALCFFDTFYPNLSCTVAIAIQPHRLVSYTPPMDARWKIFDLGRWIQYREIIYERSPQECEIGSLIKKLQEHPVMKVPLDKDKGKRVPAIQLEWAWSRGLIPTSDYLMQLDRHFGESLGWPLDCVELVNEITSRLLLVHQSHNSKLEALKSEIRGFCENKQELPLIVILVSYDSTRKHLAVELNDGSMPVYSLSGKESQGTCRITSSRFSRTGGVLICTNNLLDSIPPREIGFVQFVICYEEAQPRSTSWKSPEEPGLAISGAWPTISAIRAAEDAGRPAAIEVSLEKWIALKKVVIKHPA